MCVRMMDTKSKHTKIDCPFKYVKHGSKLRWRPPRVSTEEDEASKQCRASAVKATIRKYLRRQPKRAQLAKVAEGLGVVGKRRPVLAGVYSHHPGAMAPENTTQYLMNNVYEDMQGKFQALPVSHSASAQLYGEPMSPSSVYAALDSDYESSLAFQQRDFDEVFDLCW
ncbi:hypothetical protein EXN66_Car020825 [Channa argus]|uniref:Uncharacterized protein n=1 Tax=Channa argus TaxID=215402 RepID=A0A6G1QRL8_CHAAH|nr:hypothetical protein EXN66_Car020825 [Channa argus]KAK2883054.1 hypothetical protein Q8A73_021987 [Channa argus]